MRNFFVSLFYVVIVSVLSGNCHSGPVGNGEMDNTIAIGAILPLTGDVARYGNWIREGMDMAAEEINNDTSFKRKIKIIYEDDKCNAGTAATAMNKLADIDRVNFVVGSWCSSSVLAQAPIAEKNKIILLSEGLSPKISEAGKYTFRVIPTGKIYVDTLLAYMNHMNYRKCAVIYINNDFGVGITATLKEKVVSTACKIVEQQSYESGATDFKNQLLKVAAAKPDVVLLVGYEEAGYILKQAREMNIALTFMGMDTFENDDIIKIAGHAADNIVYPHFFYENDTLVNKPLEVYQHKYQQKYHHLSEGFAAVSYDAIYLIATTLKTIDATDKDKLLDAIQNSRYHGVTGLTSFDSNGDAKKSIILKVVRDGRFIKMEQ